MIAEKTQTVASEHGLVAQPHAAPELPAPAQRAMTFALVLSALRCTIQYVILPFVLPWIGVASSIPPWVTLVLGGIALASLTRNVMYLWRLRHARRWSYLGLALIVALALVAFMAMDAHNLLAS